MRHKPRKDLEIGDVLKKFYHKGYDERSRRIYRQMMEDALVEVYGRRTD